MNLFGAAKKNDQGYTFRKMKPRDVDAALDIIEDHDEDDAAEAAHTFSGDLSGYFVVEANGFVVGCTGYSRITDAPTSAWLAWTYVDDEMRGQGVASFMMEELRFVLMKTKVERLFISTGDWKEGDVDIYAEARRFYERLGAVRELVIEDYYSKGEATYIYRLPLETSAFMPPSVEPGGGISFRGLDVLPESDTGYVLLWDEMMEEGDRDAEDQGADRTDRRGPRGRRSRHFRVYSLFSGGISGVAVRDGRVSKTRRRQ